MNEVREILKTMMAKAVVARPKTIYMDLVDEAEQAINSLIEEAQKEITGIITRHSINGTKYKRREGMITFCSQCNCNIDTSHPCEHFLEGWSF